MDLAHLHLMLNHVPVVGIAIGFAVLLAGAVARSRGISGAGLAIIVFSALVAVPVYLTGESAEELIEKLPGSSESLTSQHESAAALSLALVIASGVFALGAGFLAFVKNTDRPNILVIGTLLVALITGTSMFRTANLGGQIRHTEIRGDGSVINTDTGQDKTSAGTRETDDDD
jgi:uncharacterized membrane protein